MTFLPLLAALVPLTTAPTFNFTTDSPYTKESILTLNIETNEVDETKTLCITKNYVFGVDIYDNPETEYIDGLKIDDNFVTDWKVPNFDENIVHTILIKTQYTDDLSGAMYAAAKGDVSRLLSNPLIIIQLAYFILAIISVVGGAIAGLVTKHSKVKHSKAVATDVTSQVTDRVLGIVSKIVVPTMTNVQTQFQKIIKAIALSQIGTKESQLALLDTLEDASTTDLTEMFNGLRQKIEEIDSAKKEAEAQALDTLDQLKTLPETTEEVSSDDGTSI